MTDDTYGATVAKRRLSRRLTALRVENGYTANQVCDRLNWGRGKVGRFEANAWVRPEMSDIRDLIRIYNVPEDVQKELEDLAMVARDRAWWREYSDVFDNEFPGYEADAARISVYFPLIVPGLLQTPAYMEAQLRSGSRSSSWRNRAVGARLRRQGILDRTDGTAPELIAVITEASLLYRWGAVPERRSQIEHLVEMSRRPNVELRLLRLEDGLHPGMLSSIHVYEFPGDEPPMVYLENDVAVQEVEKADDLKLQTATFDMVRESALEPAATTAHLKQLAENME